MSKATVNFPTTLTLIRLIVSPLLLPLLFAFFLPANTLVINSLLAGFFLLLSITDFLDGYLARRYGQETYFGQLLDPIADKFLLYSTLITLVHVKKLYFYWAILFLGREFFVMGLREIALARGIILRVISSAKIKTALQNVALAWVIINPYQENVLPATLWCNTLETVLLSSALFFSLSSAYSYGKIFLKNIRGL